MKVAGIPGFARVRNHPAFLAIDEPHASGIRRQHPNARRLPLPSASLPIDKGAKK
jgi:hypothetical protein